LEYFNRAEKLEPSNLKCKLLIATTLLRLKRFKEGWPAYNKFIATPIALKNIPTWNQDKLTAEQLLLIWTSSRNDDLVTQILFSCMLTEAQADAKNIMFQCDAKLLGIFRHSFPGLKVVSNLNNKAIEQSRSAITQQIALSTLAQFYRASADSFSMALSASLTPNKERKLYYRNKYQKLFPNKKLVGISWRSLTNNNATDHIKSSHLSAWQDILNKAGCQFISLQTGAINEVKDYPGIYIDDTKQLDNGNNFEELSAQLAALDSIITVDNHVAHLAGALGLDVYTMLPLQAEWYWFNDHNKSTFYRSMSIVRQKTSNDWGSALKEIANLI